MKNPLANLRKPAAPADTADPLATKAIHRNLLSSGDGTSAWFVMSAERWAYLTRADRDGLLTVSTLRWADLAGHRVHMRVTNEPMPYSAWAERLDRHSPNRLPDEPGAESWADYLHASQRQIMAAQLGDPAVYFGVRLTAKALTSEQLERVTNSHQPHLPDDLEKVRRSLRRVTEAVRKEGFGANPVSARGLGWLMHASVGLGAPVSTNALAAATDGWSEGDLDAFTAPVRVTATPYAPTVQITALRDGREHTHHAAILTASRFAPRDTDNPGLSPWIAYSQRLPFAVEWSMTFEVLSGQEMSRRAEFDRRRAENVEAHYQEHSERPPAEVGRAIEDASRIEDEVSAGTREVAVRVAGPVRVAVFGRTEEQAATNVAEFTDAYARDQKIEWVQPRAQYAHLREFIPGHTHLRHPGHIRVMPAYFAATAVPNASTGLGDGVGPYLGQVVGGGRRAVMLDPTFGPRQNKSGLCVFSGGLGSGKSATAGNVVESAVRRGHRSIIFDPSGPLANLVDLPHLRRHARHIELSGAEPGTLNPYVLVPEPRRQDFPHEQAWLAEVREAEAERRDLMYDTLVSLLPPQIITREAGTVSAIEDAVNACGGTFGMNPWRVVHFLENSGGEVGKAAANRLRQAATMKGGALIFPTSETTENFGDDMSDATLTVITMRGIVTPPGDTGREHWSRQERMAVPVLHLASRYASRAMYADKDPKVIITDEGGIIAAGASSFRSFLLRGSRDSRKYNTFFGLLMQNPSDALAISPEINNLTGMAIVGRTEDEQAAKASLRLLNVKEGYGYENVLTRLQTGQFLMRDWHGRVEKIQVDLAHRPNLLAALNTTPRDPDELYAQVLEGAFA